MAISPPPPLPPLRDRAPTCPGTHIPCSQRGRIATLEHELSLVREDTAQLVRSITDGWRRMGHGLEAHTAQLAAQTAQLATLTASLKWVRWQPVMLAVACVLATLGWWTR